MTMFDTHPDLRRASRIACAPTALLGLAALAGWMFDVEWMRSGFPEHPPMMPNTAIGLVLVSVAAWLLDSARTRRWIIVARVAAALVIAAGGMTLVEMLTGVDWGVNHLFFHDRTFGLVTPVQARPLPRTGVCQVLIGVALLLRDRGRRPTQLAEFCLVGLALLALSVLIGYAYATGSPGSAHHQTGMSLPTSLAFLLVGAGLLLAAPHGGFMEVVLGEFEGSRLFRRLLPALVLVPVAVVGAAVLLEHEGISPLGAVSTAVTMIGVLGTLAWWNCRNLNRLDAERTEALREVLRSRDRLEELVTERTAELQAGLELLRAGEERLRSILDNLVDGVVIFDEEGTIQAVNPASERLFGLTNAEITGLNLTVLLEGSGSGAAPPLRDLVGDLDADRVRTELRGRRSDGSSFPLELTVGAYRWRERRYFSGVVRDIGPQLLAAEAMRRRMELQDELKMVAETVPGAICSFRIAPDGWTTMPFATPKIVDLYGLPLDQLAKDFSPFYENVHLGDLRELNLSIERALREKGPWHSKFRYRHPVKGERWIEGWSTPRVEPDGSVLWFGFVTDVTEQEREAASRRESERMARAVLDALPSQIAVLDETGKILEVNQSWLDFGEANGSKVQVWQGLDYLAACCGAGEESDLETEPDSTRRFVEGIRKVIAGDLDSFEVEYPCHSPTRRRWFLARVSPFAGTGPRYVVVSHREITQVKIAQQWLREGEDRIRTLVDGISQFAWMADAVGSIYWYNKRWYDYTGASPEEVAGGGWRAFMHPDHLERIEAGVARCLSTREPWEDTFPIRSMSGEYRWFLTRAMPVLDVLGDTIRWFGTNTDITERMELEAALKENDRRKDLFIAMLGHELRNPLATIQVVSELLESTNDPDESEHARQLIRRQVAHLNRLLGDLLDVSRITRGLVRLDKQRVDVDEIVAASLDAMRPLVEARGQTLESEPAREPLPTLADPARLGQIVENLVGNAIKYTPAGGSIRVETLRNGDEILIRVRDTGVGIAAEDLPRLFEPFVQGERTFDRSDGGLGIGLTIAANLARLHGGRIEVASEGPGLGSEFVVHLPIDDAPVAPASVPYAPREDRTVPARIVVIDDNRELAKGLARVLGAFGYEVASAFDGPEGIDLVHSFRPDVIILDLGLPIMDGYEVARTLRADPVFADVPIVAISGYAQEEDRRRTAELGFREHLAKPVESRVLAEVIERVRRPVREPDPVEQRAS